MANETTTKKKGPRYGVWFIMILLFIGLLGFGTGGLGGNIRSVGTVGEKEINVATYQRALTDQIRAFEAQVGTTLTFQQAQAFGIDQAVLGQVVASRALDNEASSLGISVGDERVATEVLRVPGFQGLNGEFDREAYRFALQQTGLTESQFEDSIREEIARTLLQGAVVGGVPAPDTYADTVVSYITERRDISWATVDATALTEPQAGPTDADLTAFYEANPDLFTLPQERNITYAWLTPAMIADDIVIDEAAIAELYNERLSDFVQPERRLVERLVFGDEAQATAALARVTNGEATFDDLVADRGLDLADVDMGDVAQDELGAAGDAVFAAQAGDIVGPFNTSLGPALFRMNAILSAEETTLEEATADLRAELATARARRVIDDARDGITDLMAGGATLEDLAERTDLQLGSLAWTPDTTDDIAAYEEFRAAAEAAQEGDFASLEELSDGGVFALRLDGITPPALQPQEEIQGALIAAWDAAQTKQAVMDRAFEIADTIRPLTSLESLGLTANEEPEISRRSFIEGTPPNFTETVYEMDEGGIEVLEAGDNAIIVRLNRIYAADDEAETSANRETVADTAAAGIAQDIFEVFSGQVQQRTDIVLDQAAINAVNASLQ
ncbi:SurA N-terminal domain-containing protein [Yoonia sp. 208BN28-4]|uniref:SurA N-terminal domain-containing protein n=1 Tax=Yoonia sp. 208BN28-4 TaxID=3126505 RepID=UPI0030AB9D24